jgi:hypothetical protein
VDRPAQEPRRGAKFGNRVVPEARVTRRSAERARMRPYRRPEIAPPAAFAWRTRF